MDIGEFLRDVRTASGLTQAELAERRNVSQAGQGKTEQREANPTWDTIRSIVDATGGRLTVEFTAAGGERVTAELGSNLDLARLWTADDKEAVAIAAKALRSVSGIDVRILATLLNEIGQNPFRSRGEEIPDGFDDPRWFVGATPAERLQTQLGAAAATARIAATVLRMFDSDPEMAKVLAASMHHRTSTRGRQIPQEDLALVVDRLKPSKTFLADLKTAATDLLVGKKVATPAPDKNGKVNDRSRFEIAFGLTERPDGSLPSTPVLLPGRTRQAFLSNGTELTLHVHRVPLQDLPVFLSPRAGVDFADQARQAFGHDLTLAQIIPVKGRAGDKSALISTVLASGPVPNTFEQLPPGSGDDDMTAQLWMARALLAQALHHLGRPSAPYVRLAPRSQPDSPTHCWDVTMKASDFGPGPIGVTFHKIVPVFGAKSVIRLPSSHQDFVVIRIGTLKEQP